MKNIIFYTNIGFIFQAEARAEFAEKTVKKLQKEVDRLEGKFRDLIFINSTLFIQNVVFAYFYYTFSLAQ